jgi:elongation factor Ts
MADAKLIKELREKTGAGILDCKKALLENNDNIEQASDWLRKKGVASAAKKGDRTAAEGLIAISNNGKQAYIIELNSETDFVAKNEAFHKLAIDIIDSLKNNNTNDIEQLQTSDGKNIKDEITNAISIIGENIQLRRFAKLDSQGFIATYIHNSIADNFGKIGVLLSINTSVKNDEIELLGKQIAMHIAANNPVSVSSSDIPEELILKEKEIFIDQAKASGKPDNIIEKMVEGRINKYYKEVALIEQAFVIDGKTPIKDLISDINKKFNCNFSINNFVRYQVGEGIEKKDDNFADEARNIAANN